MISAACDLAVMAAMSMELQAVREGFPLLETLPSAGSNWEIRETPTQDKLWIARCGVGAKHADGLLATLRQRSSINRVLLVGCAGGLDPALSAGQAVIASECRNLSSGVTHFSDPALVEQLQALLPLAQKGGMATTSRVLASAREKSDLFNDTGFLAVDMEAALLAEKSATHKLAFACLKMVSDCAHETLLLENSPATQPDTPLTLADFDHRLRSIASMIADLLAALTNPF